MLVSRSPSKFHQVTNCYGIHINRVAPFHGDAARYDNNAMQNDMRYGHETAGPMYKQKRPQSKAEKVSQEAQVHGKKQWRRVHESELSCSRHI